MLRKVFVDAPRNVFHLRHLFKHDFVEFFLCALVLSNVDFRGIHGVISNA
jgi:hypothetical protein